MSNPFKWTAWAYFENAEPLPKPLVKVAADLVANYTNGGVVCPREAAELAMFVLMRATAKDSKLPLVLSQKLRPRVDDVVSELAIRAEYVSVPESQILFETLPFSLLSATGPWDKRLGESLQEILYEKQCKQAEHARSRKLRKGVEAVPEEAPQGGPPGGPGGVVAPEGPLPILGDGPMCGVREDVPAD